MQAADRLPQQLIQQSLFHLLCHTSELLLACGRERTGASPDLHWVPTFLREETRSKNPQRCQRPVFWQEALIKPDDGLSLQEMPSGTSLIEPSQVPSTVGFQRGSKAGTAPLPWHRSTPRHRHSLGGSRFTPHSWCSCCKVCLRRTGGKTKQNKTFGSVFCQPTHKTNTIVTQKGEANFSFLSIWREFWNPRWCCLWHHAYIAIQPHLCHELPTV